MGYLIKTKDKILMFYSKPVNGYYYDGRNRITYDEYDSWEQEYSDDENLVENMSWHNDWCDTSANDNECYGTEISQFICDCIMQGNSIESETPIEFSTVKIQKK